MGCTVPLAELGTHYPQCSAVYAPLLGLYHNLYSGMVLSRVLCVKKLSVICQDVIMVVIRKIKNKGEKNN